MRQITMRVTFAHNKFVQIVFKTNLPNFFEDFYPTDGAKTLAFRQKIRLSFKTITSDVSPTVARKNFKILRAVEKTDFICVRFLEISKSCGSKVTDSNKMRGDFNYAKCQKSAKKQLIDSKDSDRHQLGKMNFELGLECYFMASVYLDAKAWSWILKKG